jgi:hypothetical protein
MREWTESKYLSVMTAAGRALTAKTVGMDWLTQRPLWVAASIDMVRVAQGDVHIFLSSSKFPEGGIFLNTEYPLIRNNPKVNMIFHVVK